MEPGLVIVGLVALLMLGSLAAAAVTGNGYGAPDTVGIGVLGAIGGAAAASLAYLASYPLAVLAESMPRAALCALAGPHGC